MYILKKNTLYTEGYEVFSENTIFFFFIGQTFNE